MEKEEIKDYIERLTHIEKQLSNDEDDIDMGFIDELGKVLTNLNKDIQTNLNSDFNKVEVKIKKLTEDAVIPTYSKDGDAGMDLTITQIISDTSTEITYGFGIAIEIPKGYVGLLFPRSSVRKYDLLLSNSVGVIDSGYRGEIQVTFKFTNETSWNKKYNVGERGAQIIIIPYPQIKFIESETLSDSERKDGGFGSSGL